MTFKINTSVPNAYLDNFYGQTTTADETNTSAVVVQANNQAKSKLPPIEKTVSFTALGCDTEAKLAYAGYMAAAARNGIADRDAQMQFADSMMRQNGQLQSENLGQLDDGKVRTSFLNREVEFTINDNEKAALTQFRANYEAAGGKIRFNKNPTIDVRQAKTTDGVAPLPTETPKNLKVSVLLNNDGSAITSERMLAQYAENTYKNNSLWGDNFRRIGELSADQGIKPKITNITDVGNKKLVEFELSPRDRSVIHENYKLVQTEVNRARAAYEDFANNNEVSSFLRGVFNGAVGAVKNTVGLLNLPETMKALWQIVSSPKETFNALMTELGETWEEFKNAPPNKKSEMVGELVGAAVVEILLGKGIGKAGSILAKTKTGAKLLENADALKTATVAKIAETFSDEAASAAANRLRGRLQQTVLYGGIPADMLADFAVVSANKIKNGAVKFADFARQMVDDFGDAIKPHLEKLYRERMVELGLGKEIDEVGIKNTKLDEIILDPDAIIAPPKAVRRRDLAGKNHPITGTYYDRNGYPVFSSEFDAKLPGNLRGSAISDYDQFKEATKQLKRKIEANPSFGDTFSKEQLADIMAEKTKITGFTWHHHQDGIRLQLVDEWTHAKSGHDGGRKNTGGRP